MQEDVSISFLVPVTELDLVFFEKILEKMKWCERENQNKNISHELIIFDYCKEKDILQNSKNLLENFKSFKYVRDSERFERKKFEVEAKSFAKNLHIHFIFNEKNIFKKLFRNFF